MEDKETLEAGTVVGKLSDAVQDSVHNLLSDGVVTTGVVVSSIFLATNDLLRVVELGVGTAADFVTDGGLKIDEDGTGDMMSTLSLAEESVERVISDTERLVRVHGTIRVDSVLQAVQLPAVITCLDTGLTQMDGDTFYILSKQQQQ